MLEKLLGQKGLVANVSRTSRAHVEAVDFEFNPVEARPKQLQENQFFIPLSRRQFKTWKEIKKKAKGEATATFSVYKEHRRIQWLFFYPFGVREAEEQNAFGDKPRMGIGSIVHHHITEFLARNYPNHIIRHLGVVHPGRKRHLEAMGITQLTPYPIEAYRDIVRRFMARKFAMRF